MLYNDCSTEFIKHVLPKFLKPITYKIERKKIGFCHSKESTICGVKCISSVGKFFALTVADVPDVAAALAVPLFKSFRFGASILGSLLSLDTVRLRGRNTRVVAVSSSAFVLVVDNRFDDERSVLAAVSSYCCSNSRRNVCKILRPVSLITKSSH